MEINLSKTDKDEIVLRVVKEIKDVFNYKLRTYSVSEIANILDCHPNTVRGYIDKNILKATKKGKSFVITQQSLNNFVNEKV